MPTQPKQSCLTNRRRLLGSMIDSLEPRRLLASTVKGTSGNDAVIITVGAGNAISLTLNGVIQSVATPGDGVVEVHGLNGNDDITLLSNGTLHFFLFGEQGDDDFIVGNGNLTNDIKADVNIIEPSGAGNDTCQINNLNGAGLSWRTDGSSVSFLSIASPFIELPAMIEPGDGTTVRAGNGDDTLNLSGGGIAGAFPAKTYFDLGGGSDTVNLGGSQQIVEPNLPTSSIIDAGTTGSNSITADDSSSISSRTSLDFDDNGLVGGPVLRNFDQMTVTAHSLTGGLPEPMTFRGFNAPVPLITLVGTGSADLVQFGTLANPITSQNYWGAIHMNLGTGVNNVEVNQAETGPAASWTFSNSGLSVGTGPASLTSFSTLQFTLRATNSADLFTFVDAPDTWSTFIEARGGDDRVQMSTVLDLDAVFDGRDFYFQGGEGNDTIDVSDANDAVGDIDDYRIGNSVGFGDDIPVSDGSIEKKDFAASIYEFVLAYQGTEKLILGLDNDSNNLFYNFKGLSVVDISGNNGSDIFTNSRPNFFNPDQLSPSLAPFVTFRGGAGADELVLRDTDGDVATYEFFDGLLSYGQTISTRTLNFDNFSSVRLAGSNLANNVIVRFKGASTTLNIDAAGGDDTFTVGGGDLDSSGLMSTGLTLNGGAGSDAIVFDDRLDTAADGETSNYTFNNFSLAKGTPAILFSTFEDVGLLASNHTVSGINVATVVNINSVNGFVDNLSITGGPDRGCIVNAGSGTLGNLPLTSTFVTCSSVNINDQSTATGTAWTIGTTAIARTTSNQTFNYQASAIALNTGTGDDTIGVNGLGAGSLLNVNAGNGVDRFTLGNGDVDAQVLGPVALIGGADNNGLTVNNSIDVLAESQSLSNTTFIDNFTHTFSGLTSYTYNGGPGGTNLSLSNAVIPQTINGGSGDDTFHLFNGSLITNFTANFILNGNGGTDTMNLLGQSDSASSRYDFPTSTQFRFGDVNTGKILTYSGFEQASLQTSSASDTLNVTSIPFALRISTGTGNDVVNISNIAGQVSTLPITINTGPETTSFGGGDDLTVGGATVVVDQSDVVRNLVVNGTLRITNGAVLTRVPPSIDFLPLSLTGVFDLADGALLWKAGGQTPDFRAMLIAGRNGGAWNGTSASGAMNSSTAASSSLGDGVGYGLGSEIAPTTLGGFTIAPADVLVRYTLEGDANLDRTVNFPDLVRLAQNYDLTNRGFSQGDFNYSPDGKVDFADLVILAQRYGSSLPAVFETSMVAPQAPSKLPGKRRPAGEDIF
jgi:hypothetical protein